MKCFECDMKNYFCGQAFTEYNCIGCGENKMHHNTATPKLCDDCSEKANKCNECGKEL